MSEPTLTELREMATACATEYPASHIVRAVARAFLRFTDPAPLTAEHCREAGCFIDLGDGFVGDGTIVWLNNESHQDAIRIDSPTVGQLRLALLQENRE